MLHVFLGTKAQYVKMAPLLWRMDRNDVAYRLIDSGQHGELSASFREELGIRPPDVLLGRGEDVNTIPQAVGWAGRLGWRCASRSRLRQEVFGGHHGMCVVHGDTPTTLISALMARRAGLGVAHVEAGLRTYRWFHPFPEEIVRVVVGRLADVLFAPDDVAASNLRRSGVKGRIVAQQANTVLESVVEHLGRAPDANEAAKSDHDGPHQEAHPVVVTMHRVENLHRPARRDAMVRAVEALAATTRVRWVMHGPTQKALSEQVRGRLGACGVEVVSLMSHRDFLELLARAPFVITDGGSIQEECALLGVPTLLWRDRTDRKDGLGHNVVLSHYRPEIVDDFLADPQRHRREMHLPETTPSEQILNELEPWT